MQFIDLSKQQERIRENVEQGFLNVLNHGGYIMGKEVHQLESDLSDYCGAKHTLSCSSGTDALLLPLMAWGIGTGDAVFVPAFTFTATGEVVKLVGATPVFVDVDSDTYNICPNSLKQGIADAKAKGLNPKAVIGVDLFGLSADWDAIIAIAKDNNLKVLDDAAQGFGAVYKDEVVGNIPGVDATATSFYPAKPLGAYGDGGATFTNDDALNEIMVSMRVHGQDNGDKYKNAHVGLNARLDTLQAVVLIEKLKIFADEVEKRNTAAQYYTDALKDVVKTPFISDDHIPSWAQYTIQVKDRAKTQAKFQDAGIPCAVFYPIPMHKQAAYSDGIVAGGALPVSEHICNTVMSVPMHPYITTEDQDKVINALK